MKKSILTFTALLAALVLLAGCSKKGGDAAGAPAKSEPKRVMLQWVSGNENGGWYIINAGLSKLIAEQAPHIQITVVPGGGVMNCITVGEGESELGFGMPNLVMDAAQGRAPFEKKYEDLRGIANGFSSNYYHLVAAQSTGVKTFDDLVKYPKLRMDVTQKGSSGEDVFAKIMKFYLNTSYEEWEKKGAKFDFNAYSAITANFGDRHIDFTGVNIIPPTSVVQECAAARPINLVALPEDLRQTMRAQGYGLATIKKEMYPSILTEDVPTITTGTMAMCNKSLDDEVVYTITKIICENPERLANIDKGLSGFMANEPWKDMPIPLHPGAERYYREKGYIK
ncbi:MAG: TAXI family TRAP transporter solute-binding subunit [Spirochaetaceae bacterium]|jgi:TRAP transporter TAXI family solute receptor|nr:TAXI family TRAP transporter solute-binding subunit [Spirochaetaceae bacterium]